MIAGAFGSEKIQLGIFRGQALGFGGIAGQAAICQARQQRPGLIRQAIGQTQIIGEPRQVGASGIRGILRRARSAFHQKRRPAFHAAQHAHAALGLLPVIDDYVLQLVVQKFFRRALVLRRHFDEIRQHAQRPEIRGVAARLRAEQAPHRIGGVGAMRQNVTQRGFASFQPGEFFAQRLDPHAQFRRRGFLRRQIFFGAMALVSNGFELHLPPGKRLRKRGFGGGQPVDFGG